METNQRLEYALATLIRFRKLWLIPAVAGVALALIYVFLFRGDTWSARQSLIVRDDLLGQAFKPGQFNSLESMKSAQETILEIARKPQVIRNVLTELGPAKTSLFGSGDYPSDETIEDVQGMIGFSAPNGAEFGKTEVIILNTKSSSPERSKHFIELLLDQIDSNIGEVRERRLLSMESELSQARDGAALSLEQSAKKLREMEGGLGADLGAMHGLNSPQGSDSIRTEVAQIRVEERGAQKDLDAALAAQEMLMSARLSPQEMLAAPSEFLRSQPKLEALQKSLADAQQAYATHFGRYEAEHPSVVSSAATITAMQNQIYLELDTLIRSVESNISELRGRIARLDDLANDGNQKMAGLGSIRVDHLTINAELTKKTEIFNLTQSRLSEIQAMRMAAPQIEWLTRVDEPQVATRPDGMGKKSTILAGGFCGLMLGFGLVMLVAPPMEVPTTGRRTDITRRTEDARLAALSLDEIVGPTAASALHSASAATAGAVSKGVSMAKSAWNKSRKKEKASAAQVNIPHLDAEAAPPVTAPQSPTAPNPPARPADNPSVTQQPQAAANFDSAPKDSLTAEKILTDLGKESLPSSVQTNPTASPTSIPATSSPTKTTAAPPPARPQTDVYDQEELMRRAANMRPVDIVRSVDAEDEADTDASATSDFAEASASASQPPSENPFLKHLPRSGAASQASRSASRQPVLPTEPAPTSKPPAVERRPATTVPLQANPTLPIPDQIRELADSITNFGKTSES